MDPLDMEGLEGENEPMIEDFPDTPEGELESPEDLEEDECDFKTLQFRKIKKMLLTKTCYDAMQDSGKVVVLDTRISIRIAFFALLENGIPAAPLWNAERSEYEGMLTMSDFVRILQYFYHSNQKGSEDKPLKSWLETLPIPKRQLISVSPDLSLFDVASCLVKFNVGRMPVIDKTLDNSLLCVLSHIEIVSFLLTLFDLHYVENGVKPVLNLNFPLSELEIGTMKNVITATRSTPIINLIRIMDEKNISGVPIVDENGVFDTLYSKTDVNELARGKLYQKLDGPVSSVLELKYPYRKEAGRRVCVTLDDPFSLLLHRMSEFQVRRVVVVDASQKVLGVISASDVLKFILSNC